MVLSLERLVFNAVVLVVLCGQQVEGYFDCIGTCYSGRFFPKPRDIFYGQHLKGFSYKNITTDDPRKCYSFCAQDCCCKACQMKDARCELLDEDKTTKAGNFVADSGYVYYDLKQSMYQGKSHMLPPGVNCHNGCCRSQPCMNGGSCIEHCKSPKEKYACLCQSGYFGRACEKELNSCKDILISYKTFPKDGVYWIINSLSRRSTSVYCSFTAPNQAWTLVESFSFKDNMFKKVPFFETFAMNEDMPPSWMAYRMRRGRMRYIRTLSTLFRATCDFPKRSSSSLTPDLLIGSLGEVDIISDHVHTCKRYKLINIKGYQCKNCTALTCQGCILGKIHFHIDVMHNMCEFQAPITYGTDSFGYYQTIEKNFTCNATPESTTQYWLGQEL